jgi:hypothetical protein
MEYFNKSICYVTQLLLLLYNNYHRNDICYFTQHVSTWVCHLQVFLQRHHVKYRYLPSRGLRSGSAAAWLLGLCSNPPGTCISVSCMMSGRGLCVWMITRAEESYWMWRVWMWSWGLGHGEAMSHWGAVVSWKKKSGSVLCTVLTLR